MSNSLTVIGTIKTIGERQQITEKFAKRIFTIEVKNGNYTDMVALQFVNDRTDLIDPYAIGTEVRVHFNPKSREYNGNYYTELTAWGIAKNEAANATPLPNDYSGNAKDMTANLVTNAPSQPAATPQAASGDATSDLPF